MVVCEIFPKICGSFFQSWSQIADALILQPTHSAASMIWDQRNRLCQLVYFTWLGECTCFRPVTFFFLSWRISLWHQSGLESSATWTFKLELSCSFILIHYQRCQLLINVRLVMHLLLGASRASFSCFDFFLTMMFPWLTFTYIVLLSSLLIFVMLRSLLPLSFSLPLLNNFFISSFYLLPMLLLRDSFGEESTQALQ